MSASMRRPLPPELLRALFQTLIVDVPCIALLVVATLVGYLGHRLLLAAVLATVAVIGLTVVWARFFQKLAAYKRQQGLR